MHAHFLREVALIKDQVARQGMMVHENFVMAMEAFIDGDNSLGKRVLEIESEVDSSEVSLEEECLKAIALHQPVADDLRFLISVIRANHNLERIGDQAARIARFAGLVLPESMEPLRLMVRNLGALTSMMIYRAVHALIERAGEEALLIWHVDRLVDRLHDETARCIQEEVSKNPAVVKDLFNALDAINRIERAADHAANIAKAVLYLVLGHIVRHHRKQTLQEMRMPKIRVLFVDDRDAGSGRMAQSWINHAHGDHFTAESAALHPEEPNPLISAVMAEVGADITAYAPRGLHEYFKTEHALDFVIVLGGNPDLLEALPNLPGSACLAWNHPDPATGPDFTDSLDALRTYRNMLTGVLDRWVKMLLR